MDNYRAFLAIVISFVILLGYQYLFVGFDAPPPEQPAAVSEKAAEPSVVEQGVAPESQSLPEAVKKTAAPVVYDRKARSVTVDTDLYTAVFSEDGGTMTSLVLKEYRQTNKKDSEGMQLITSTAEQGYPLGFSWGSVAAPRVLYSVDTEELTLGEGRETAELRMVADAGNGMRLERVYTFRKGSYLIDLAIKVTNGGSSLLQGEPRLDQIDASLGGGTSSSADRFLFGGPAAYVNGELHEVKPDDFSEAPITLNGNIDWAGYEGNYFLCAILPLEDIGRSFQMEGTEELVHTSLAGKLTTLEPGAAQTYTYRIFYGPKKLSLLKEIGYNLDKAVNFGWFTVIAKPMLWLLNMLYQVVLNYGVAIVLVTILIKALFWPITQKGMKSMKNMQKLQPKMAKLKEKYKDDPQQMNREVMNLYKTYKVNPLGGCLPMLIQIPFFFALYRVLLQSIELRHAPFMLWISDLSAPDRLSLGFDIPYLGGLPVLTLLMGASMFLQQKMTPTTADPTQARIMMFLPVIFTFMFFNFPAGLVLYWLTNNLLSILQQVLINREKKEVAAT